MGRKNLLFLTKFGTSCETGRFRAKIEEVPNGMGRKALRHKGSERVESTLLSQPVGLVTVAAQSSEFGQWSTLLSQPVGLVTHEKQCPLHFWVDTVIPTGWACDPYARPMRCEQSRHCYPNRLGLSPCSWSAAADRRAGRLHFLLFYRNLLFFVSVDPHFRTGKLQRQALSAMGMEGCCDGCSDGLR
ncbi:hypothetical protein HPTL_P071 (plasmid) [Hydrogenophilus thermoluteolus]|uniref:Uncharacterized protein n=1 Tax=Hydrogenophilus thermoluteolus TaxID=297 RepID=A0A2Z6E0U9_HYDTE|nr:hypothetical protein HPTL_P071 [Hydrogenophilus thermoluteolus]